MEYNFTAYNAFIRRSEGNFLSASDYKALSNPSPKATTTPVTDTVTLGSQRGREAIINQLTKSGGTNPLFGSLRPSGGLGMGGGLYAGVGQLAAHQVKSLIDGYV